MDEARYNEQLYIILHSIGLCINFKQIHFFFILNLILLADGNKYAAINAALWKKIQKKVALN